MAYRRFKIADLASTPATLANLATVCPNTARSVANVATVAASHLENTISEEHSVAVVASVAGVQAENKISTGETGKAGSVSFVSDRPGHSVDFFAPDLAGTWAEEDWQAAFDERAAILEYDGGWSREAAEQLARQWIAEHRARRMQ